MNQDDFAGDVLRILAASSATAVPESQLMRQWKSRYPRPVLKFTTLCDLVRETFNNESITYIKMYSDMQDELKKLKKQISDLSESVASMERILAGSVKSAGGRKQ